MWSNALSTLGMCLACSCLLMAIQTDASEPLQESTDATKLNYETDNEMHSEVCGCQTLVSRVPLMAAPFWTLAVSD